MIYMAKEVHVMCVGGILSGACKCGDILDWNTCILVLHRHLNNSQCG